MAYGKGRATGYSAYYKNQSDTPDSAEEDTIQPKTFTPKARQLSMDERRAAIKRRLQKRAGK